MTLKKAKATVKNNLTQRRCFYAQQAQIWMDTL